MAGYGNHSFVLTRALAVDKSNKAGDVYGKMLVLTFEDSEEEILNHIISCVSMGVRAFQVIENTKTNLSFNGLEIDDINRSVRKQKQEIDWEHPKVCVNLQTDVR